MCYIPASQGGCTYPDCYAAGDCHWWDMYHEAQREQAYILFKDLGKQSQVVQPEPEPEAGDGGSGGTSVNHNLFRCMAQDHQQAGTTAGKPRRMELGGGH